MLNEGEQTGLLIDIPFGLNGNVTTKKRKTAPMGAVLKPGMSVSFLAGVSDVAPVAKVPHSQNVKKPEMLICYSVNKPVER